LEQNFDDEINNPSSRTRAGTTTTTVSSINSPQQETGKLLKKNKLF